MSPGILFEVAIRIFGGLCFITSASPMVQFGVVWIAGYFGWDSTWEQMEFYMLQQMFSTVFIGILGLVLFSFARPIANWFYPHADDPQVEGPESQGTLTGVRAVDVYKVVIVVFGLYLIVQTVEPVSYLVVAVFMQDADLIREIVDPESTKAILYLAVGGLMIFGSGNISNRLAAERFETMQKPKLTFATVVVLFFLLAVLIGVIRLLMFSQRY